MDDEMLMAMKTNGGVVQINAVAEFIKADPTRAGAGDRARCAPSSACRPAAAAAGRAERAAPRRRRFAVRSKVPAPPAAVRTRRPRTRPDAALLPAPIGAPSTTAAWRRSIASIPAAGRATVKDYVDHIDYAVKLIGIDHVGIASDFDGGGGVDGWNSAGGDVQRHARARAPRLHRGADRQDLERQPAARLERGRKGGQGRTVSARNRGAIRSCLPDRTAWTMTR